MPQGAKHDDDDMDTVTVTLTDPSVQANELCARNNRVQREGWGEGE